MVTDHQNIITKKIALKLFGGFAQVWCCGAGPKLEC